MGFLSPAAKILQQKQYPPQERWEVTQTTVRCFQNNIKALDDI